MFYYRVVIFNRYKIITIINNDTIEITFIK